MPRLLLQTGRYHLPYSGGGSVWPLVLTLAVLTGGVTALALRRRWPGFCLAVGLAALALRLLGLLEGGWPLAVLLVGGLMCLLPRQGLGRQAMLAGLSLFVAAFCALVPLIPGLVPAQGNGVFLHRLRYESHPSPLPEGDLTRTRAALVCEESLYEVAQSLGLGNELRLGKGEEAGGGRCRPSILADATESVFAAVYLDGGMEAARALIHRVLLDKEQEEAVEERRRDYKTELQELVQRRSNQTLHYEMIGATGPDPAKLFTCAVLLNGQMAGTGTGKSKKEAEQAAARAALQALQ